MRDNPKSQIRGSPNLLMRTLPFRCEVNDHSVSEACLRTDTICVHSRISNQSELYPKCVDIPALWLSQGPKQFICDAGKV